MKVPCIIEQIIIELERAELKHPQWPTDIIHQAAVISEESGEMIREALQLHYENGDMALLKNELVQTAAMCIRMLKNLPERQVSEQVEPEPSSFSTEQFVLINCSKCEEPYSSDNDSAVCFNDKETAIETVVSYGWKVEGEIATCEECLT